MSVVTTPGQAAGGLRGLLRTWQAWWESTAAANRTRVQLASFVVLSLVAYHYSLSTLVSNLNLSTPLAYVGLVPAIALGLAAARYHPGLGEPSVFDRQLDYIVGLPLIGAALVINLLLPSRLSAMFWVWRIDLFSFPLFVAGAIALIFGTRALMRQRLAVIYLLLAWPLPYSLLLLQVLNGFTNLTLAALRHAVKVVHVATMAPGSDGSLFQVVHAGHPFPLSVVSACSGVDSVVGFLLVGSAFAGIVQGPRLRKGLWLAAGMALLWAINVGRIMFIFWAGQQWGEHVAINILHPFVGLITFSLGVVLMMLAMPLIGLRLRTSTPLPPEVAARRPIPVRNVLPAVGLVLVAAMVLGVADTHLRSYDIVADATGEPKLSSFSADPAHPAGWQATYETAYTWAQPYFGDSSTWLRYSYNPTGAGGDLHANLPVTADVINTTNLQSFSAYGVEACYNFHGYTMRDVATVRLTGAITGQSLSYSTSSSGTWSIVYWIMPVKQSRTSSTIHYERVILYLQDTPQTTVSTKGTTPAAGGITNLQGSLDPAKADDQRLIDDRTFLVRFADEVIDAQTHIPVGTTLQQTLLAEGEHPTVGTTAGGSTKTPSAATTSGAAPSSAASAAVEGIDPTTMTFTALAPSSLRQEWGKLPVGFQRALIAAHPTWFTHR